MTVKDGFIYRLERLTMNKIKGMFYKAGGDH